MFPKLLGKTTLSSRPDIADAARRMMLSISPVGLASVQRGMAERPDSVATLETITVPVLILVGEEDTLTPVSDAELMRGHIRGSDLRTIPRAGHYLPLEQPESCTSPFREFLETLRRA
jgi:pimeloyl-ACP methyl ester carboxylesterase